MLGLLGNTWRLLPIPLVALAFFLGAYFYFYRGDYDPPPEVKVPFEEITVPNSSFRTFTEVPSLRNGLLLVDAAHRNDVTEEEFSVLLAGVADRGFDIEFLTRPSQLDEKLRGVDSFAVVLPRSAYADGEVDIIEKFIEKGGKLLLIGDPTRDSDINSLAERFGIAFQSDYLYNMVDFDINFQNIFVKDFQPHRLTRGLGKIALYTASSIKASEPGLAFADANTRSSIVERIEPLYPLVTARDGRVLAISDLTFMIPPQNAIQDNDRLIANMADFLTESERVFELADFPHFLKGDVEILLSQPDFFDLGTEIKNILANIQVSAEVRGIEDLTRDTVFLGLYEDSAAVAQYLDVAGVQVDDFVRTPFTAELLARGTGIILLHRGEERNVLVVLAQSPRGLADMVSRLGSGRFRVGLVSEMLGVYRTF